MKSLKNFLIESVNEGRGNFVKKVGDVLGTKAVQMPAEYDKMKGMKEFKYCVDKASAVCSAPEFKDKKMAETLIAGVARWLGYNAMEINGSVDFEYWMDEAGITLDDDVMGPWLDNLYAVVKKIYNVDCVEEFA